MSERLPPGTIAVARTGNDRIPRMFFGDVSERVKPRKTCDTCRTSLLPSRRWARSYQLRALFVSMIQFRVVVGTEWIRFDWFIAWRRGAGSVFICSDCDRGQVYCDSVGRAGRVCALTGRK